MIMRIVNLFFNDSATNKQSPFFNDVYTSVFIHIECNNREQTSFLHSCICNRVNFIINHKQLGEKISINFVPKKRKKKDNKTM